MRKFCFIIILNLLFLFEASSQSFCATCPPIISFSDSNCIQTELRYTGTPTTPPTYTTLPSVVLRACKGSIVKYKLSANAVCYPNATYSPINISGGTFLSFSGNEFTVQWGSSGSGLIEIDFFSPSVVAGGADCKRSISIPFTLINSPVAVASASPQPACNGNPTNISFSSAGTTNATNFLWDFGDGNTSSAANPTHSYTNPGTYNVLLTVANIQYFNGQATCLTCVDTAALPITINVLPAPPINCVATVCAGTTQTYCASDLTCSNYTWAVSGGSIVSGQGTSCVTVLWGTGNPQGSLTLQQSGCTTTYCAQGNTVNIPIVPTTGSISGAALVCTGSTESYSLPAWTGTSYSWTMTNSLGSITPFNTNSNQVTINWTTAGTTNITCNYYDSSLKCGGSAVFTVNVRPQLSIGGPSSVCQTNNAVYVATATPSTPVNCVWTISPSGTIVSGQNTNALTANWSTPGVYNITATNITPNTVCNVASQQVTVNPKPIISNLIGPDSICGGGISVYKVSSNQIGSFNWVISGASALQNLGSNNDSIQITWNNSGPYTITVNQTSFPNNCTSNSLTKTVFTYPTPNLNGPTIVCADAVVNYSITNITNGSFNWFVKPANFGTILSGQGTSSIQIKWHGNNSPNSSNTVWLHYGVCGKDSIQITINEPAIATITPSGTLCSTGGITLSTGATGSFTWTGPTGYTPPPTGNVPSISNLNIPGLYNVSISNFNGSGCNAVASYNIPPTGFPIASISATNVLKYCLPNTPNMNLVAVSGTGYNYQWFQVGVGAVGTNSPVLPINSLTAVGTYTFYCIVTLGGCTATSNSLTIEIVNCTGGGCSASITTDHTGCNPFTFTVTSVSPSSATLIGNPTIEHLDDFTVVNSYTTKTYSTIGYKQVRLCVDVQLPSGGGICRACRDTVVHVTVAANFSKIKNCKSVNLYNASNTVSPAIINSYAWSVGTYPTNATVPPSVASYNNPTIPNPILNVTQTGTYIITLTITSGSCTVSYQDTVIMLIPNANFTFNNSCVGTPVNFNSSPGAQSYFWNFGDASTSYVNPTTHAYASANTFTVTHVITQTNGCKDTVTNNVVIAAAPTCTITYNTPLNFCAGDSVILKGCTGLTNVQWYNNGVAIPGSTFLNDTIYQTGNYHFTATSASGCKVISDTVSVNVNQKPSALIADNGNRCFGTTYVAQVQSCTGCTYVWKVDGVIQSGTSSTFAATVGFSPLTPGVHTIRAIVTNPSGCVDSSTVTINFYALPSAGITVTGGPTPYCSNNIYNLAATTNATNPSYSWQLNNSGFVFSNSSNISASAAGNYSVTITDGSTGCKATAIQTILPSPYLNLFPNGCDTLCDTVKIFLPIPSLNGNLTGYTINWYDNGAPSYTTPIFTGISLPTSLLTAGAHNLSIIATSPLGCKDTSNIYSVFIKACSVPLSISNLEFKGKQINDIALLNWRINHVGDIKHFIIEKSSDGFNFSQIGLASISNSLQYFYNTTNKQKTYYRLRVELKNGSSYISKIVELNYKINSNNEIQVIPNIVQNITQAIVHINTPGQYKVNIVALDGKIVKTENIYLQKGTNTLKFNLSSLAKGHYFIMIANNYNSLNSRFFKE